MNAQELMSKWEGTIKNSDHVFSWSGRAELAYVAEHASRAKFAVEIGTYLGRSAKVMLDAGCEHLWCVDLFMVAGTLETSRYFLRDYIKKSRCELIQKRSNEAAEQLSHMRGQLDFVFVDDGHAFEDVALDINSWLPLLRSGGILCGHDFDQKPDNDVARAVKQMLPGWTEPVSRIWQYVKP